MGIYYFTNQGEISYDTWEATLIVANDMADAMGLFRDEKFCVNENQVRVQKIGEALPGIERGTVFSSFTSM